MIELPGSFSGRLSSPNPQRGPEASQRTIVGDLHERGGERLERAVRSHQRIVCRQRGELVGGAPKRQTAVRREFRRDAIAECRVGVETRAHRRAADRQFAERGNGSRDRRLRVVQLCHVAGEFLAQRQGRCILQVGAADLDDVGEGDRFRLERRPQRVQGRQQLTGDGASGCHVHGGGKDIVGGLPEIDLIVRMHQTGFARGAAQQLRGTVREHLVHVHVGLRA